MRVMHIIPSISERHGGPSEAALHMCRYQNRQGAAPADILTTHCFYDKPRRVEGVNIFSFPSFLDDNISPGFRSWLKRRITDYDIMEIHSLFNETIWFAGRLAAKRKIPYIIRPSGQLYDWCLYNKGWFKKRLFLKCGGLDILERAAAIHLTSRNELDELAIRINNPHKYVLAHGVDPVPDISEDTVARHFPQLRDKKILLYLSRIHPKKGLEFAIEALSGNEEFKRNWLFVIAGSGERSYMKALKDLIARRGLEQVVSLTGFVDGERKHALLRRGDLFILPSHSENFGLAVAEAMAAGLPAVVSKEVGIADDITAYRAGLVCEDDPVSLRETLKNILPDEAMRKEMGENARRLVREKYSWERVTERQLAVYADIIKNKNLSA